MKGKIGSRQTKIEMFPEDVKFLAKTRLKREPDLDFMTIFPEYAKAIEWLEVGYK